MIEHRENDCSRAIGYAVQQLRTNSGQTIAEFRRGMRDFNIFMSAEGVEALEAGVGITTLQEALLYAYYFDSAILDMFAASPHGSVKLSRAVTLPLSGVCNLIGGDSAASRFPFQGRRCVQHQS